MNVLARWPPESAQPRSDEIGKRILAFWHATPLSTPFQWAVFASVFLLAGAVRIALGGFPQNAYPHDMFIFLDGAWRVLNGQRPQIDFNSNLGPLMYLFTALGFQLTHNALHSLAVAQTLFSAIIGISVGWIAFRRLEQIPAILLTSLAVLIALCPCNTGEEPFSITYAMLYNRVGFGLLAFILIEATQKPKAITRIGREELIGGTLTGFMTAFLFFLKFTYGFVAILLTAGLLLYRSQSPQRILGYLFGSSLLSLCIFWYLDFHGWTVFENLRLGAAGKHLSISEIMVQVTSYMQWIALLVMLAALSPWVTDKLRGQEERRSVAIRQAWGMLVASLAALGLLLSNAQHQGLPLAALMGVITVAELLKEHGPEADTTGHASVRHPALVLFVFVGLLIPAVNLALWDSGAFLFSILRATGFHGGGEGRVDSDVASDVRTRETYLNGKSLELYTNYINEGLQLLRANSSPNESIITLDFVNPFPYLLQRTPSRGGTTCLHYETTFDDKHHLSPDDLFGDADLVMWPISYEEPRLGMGIEKVYGAETRARFKPVAQNRDWRLLRRIEPVTQAATR